jgi:hypothetical protein
MKSQHVNIIANVQLLCVYTSDDSIASIISVIKGWVICLQVATISAFSRIHAKAGLCLVYVAHKDRLLLVPLLSTYHCR